ncbi:uncharacterized protein H6S33_011500, partial [Morchella sextelata]|uniref:uncharacterized protein n=1 Tax=Morchella sextelata TaxID=1174677 RepID=UPI001D055455
MSTPTPHRPSSEPELAAVYPAIPHGELGTIFYSFFFLFATGYYSLCKLDSQTLTTNPSTNAHGMRNASHFRKASTAGQRNGINSTPPYNTPHTHHITSHLSAPGLMTMLPMSPVGN